MLELERFVQRIGHVNVTNDLTCETGWWYTYPSEKCEFVSWDYDIPNTVYGKSCHPVMFQTTNQILWFSYVFLWLTYGFPMVFLWLSYGFPMVVLWFPWYVPNHQEWMGNHVPEGPKAWDLVMPSGGCKMTTLVQWGQDCGTPKKHGGLYIYISVYMIMYIYIWLCIYIYDYVYIYICRYVWTCWDFLKTSTMVVYPKNNSYNLGMGQTQPIRMAHFGMLPKSRRDLSSRVNRFTPQQGGAAHTCISEVSDIHKHLV